MALVLILAITAAWWALALWPLPADSPDWLQRARLVCFGSTRDTLPSPAGWSLLIGEPLSMLIALAVVWGAALRDGLLALARTLAGRATLTALSLLVVAGLAAVGARVSTAVAAERFDPTAGARTSIGDLERLDRPAPALDLTNQRGETVTLARLRGRAVLVGFVYAHCTTVCPVIVHEVLDAQRRAAAQRPALVLVTLDPWRDVPARLPAVAAEWGLGPDGHVLSGPVDAVERVLDAWEVPRTREAMTGEVTHPAFVYIVGSDGHIAYQSPAYADVLVALLERL